MGVTIYIILFISAASLYFLGSDIAGTLFKYGLLIPFIDFFVFTYDLLKGKYRLFSFFRSISFLIIAIVNYYSFIYQDLPFRTALFFIFILSFLSFLYLVRNHLKNFIVRLIVYTILAIFTWTNAWMTNLERMNFYTLGNPFYSMEISYTRLYGFAYLYNQEGDKERTYYLLNKCSEVLSQELEKGGISTSRQEELIKNRSIVQKSLTLVMQNKWNHKEEFSE